MNRNLQFPILPAAMGTTAVCPCLFSVCVACFGTSSATEPQTVCVVEDHRIHECSGLAFSRLHPNAVWMHNDSGDVPRMFLVGFDGRTRCICRLQQADAVDWEDMCAFDSNRTPWLLIADVGDNSVSRSRNRHPCTLYLLPEPDRLTAARGSVAWNVRVQFEYADGPHNCEGVAVDPVHGDILLLTKESPDRAGLYRLPLNVNAPHQNLTAERIADLPVPFATGLDLSSDGRLLAAVTLWDGWLIRRKNDRSHWQDVLTAPLQRLSLPIRRQGEAVCFSPDNRSLLLHSEHPGQPLWKLPLDDIPDDSSAH